ncbi:hypothetical protein MSPP1_004054 [Malassezia sp. CBS 17886]|nr:hypothetical protein MSPP1_004054 [Malassezia sp. CBS 17886]
MGDWTVNAGPMLRYDTIDDRDVYHAFALLVTEHARVEDVSVAPVLQYLVGGGVAGAPLAAVPVRGTAIHVYQDAVSGKAHVFWRFKIECLLTDAPQAVAYDLPGIHPQRLFQVPARMQNFRWATYSCNGFSSGVDEGAWGGADPLWRDVLEEHAKSPYHAVVGGGDQIYNDCVGKDPTVAAALQPSAPGKGSTQPLTPELVARLDHLFFENYVKWFGHGAFARAISEIPMVNMLDDHDLIDGFGTYPDDLMRAPVFNGIGSRGVFWYLLFQQFMCDPHDGITPGLGYNVNEPATPFRSLIVGGPGAYIPFPTHNLLTRFGPKQYVLLLDCRAQRKINQVCAQDTYDICFDALQRLPHTVEHLVVQLGVPLAYPRMVLLEKMLASNWNPIVWLAKKLMPKFTNDFNGQVELLDDLNDHWCAARHKKERNAFVARTQEVAVDRGVRISFLSGDVHAGACGVCTWNGGRALTAVSSLHHLKPERDPKYSVAMVTSAIVNVPPPAPVLAMVNTLAARRHKRRFGTHETMIPMFDVIGARNWCSVELNEATDELLFDLRVEKEKGSGEVKVYTVKVPPPRFRARHLLRHLTADLRGSDAEEAAA